MTDLTQPIARRARVIRVSEPHRRVREKVTGGILDAQIIVAGLDPFSSDRYRRWAHMLAK